MKRVIHFLTSITLLAIIVLSTGFGSEMLVANQATDIDRAGLQNPAVVNVFEFIAPGPATPKDRASGTGEYSVTAKLVELQFGCGFPAETILSRRVSRAVFNSFNIIPSASERTLVFPFHGFW